MNAKPNQSPRGHAFSLIELVVAVGIVAIGLLPLLAMLTFSLGQARNSKEESIAAQVSHSIFTNLRTSSSWLGGNGGVLLQVSSEYPEKTDNPNADFRLLSPGSGGSSSYVAYGYDPEGFEDLELVGVRAIAEVGAGEYGSGFLDDGGSGMRATHLARIEFIPEPALDTGGSGLFRPSLFRVVVSVEAPAAAPEENRTKFTFVSYMNLTDSMEAP